METIGVYTGHRTMTLEEQQEEIISTFKIVPGEAGLYINPLDPALEEIMEEALKIAIAYFEHESTKYIKGKAR